MVRVNFLCGQCFGAAGSAPVATLTFARPKSRIFAWPLSVTKMFAGLMSLWTIPFKCAAFRPSARYLEQRFEFHGPTLRNDVLQRSAFQKFHSDERSAIFLADVINGADVGVVQCGRRLSFPSKPCQSL